MQEEAREARMCAASELTPSNYFKHVALTSVRNDQWC